MNSTWIPIILILVVTGLCILLPLSTVIKNQNKKSHRERVEFAERHGFSVQPYDWDTLILNGEYRGYNVTIKDYRLAAPYKRDYAFHITLFIKNPKNIRMRVAWGANYGRCGNLPLLIGEKDEFYGKMKLCGDPKSFLLDFIYSSLVKRGIKKAIGRTYKIMGFVTLELENDQLVFEQFERNLWANNQSYMEYMMDWLIDCAKKIDEATIS